MAKELSNDGGNKFDGNGKLRTDLIPVEPLLALSAILTHGAKKYDDNNWKKGIKFSRVYGALLRHLWAHWLGNYEDSDSGMPHIWHAFCNLLFLVYYDYHYEDYEKYDDSQSKNLRTLSVSMGVDEFLHKIKEDNNG